MTNHYGWSPEQIQLVREKVRLKFIFVIRKFSLSYSIHHVVPKRFLKQDCWDEKYLACLCKDCHHKIEKFNNKIFKYFLVEKSKVSGGKDENN